MNPAWLLPEYIEDILPPYAARAERLRRRLLDLFDRHGYDLVIPPLVEFLDSLLTGAARDLDGKTFKVVDALSGRLLGVRADMTPQAARIDAHLLNHAGVTRLCYAGPVLRAHPQGMLASREPMQVGAEVFGHAGIEADIEVMGLMLAALEAAEAPEYRVSLGHVGLFRALVKAAGLDARAAESLFEALRRKDVPDIVELTAGLEARWRAAFTELPGLYGGLDVLARARARLPDIPELAHCLDEIASVLAAVNSPAMHIDLSDLRGDGYHTGMVMAAYAGGQAHAVALGGRYDNAGAVFGRGRPATGFSLDLRAILDCQPCPEARGGILAPQDADPDLRLRVEALRAAGERVVQLFAGQNEDAGALGCDRHLRKTAEGWAVVPA